MVSDSGSPLAGTRVLDLSRVVSGPLCGRMLADLGADVIKVEPPDGDATRRVPPFIDGVSAYYAQLNAGKRNVSVDLKAAGGVEVVARLAATVDVLLENFRPGVLARFGLDAETLLAANPKLVYCSITGWGQDGPWVAKRAYAPLVHADVGTLELAARHRRRRPEQEVNQHGDVYTATVATSAVLAALLQRVRTDRGQHLDVAMGQAAFYVNEWAAANLHGPVEGYGRFDTWNHFTYRLGDGSYVTLVGNPVNLFPAWANAFDAPEEVRNDPRFATPEARAQHLPELVDAVESLTIRFPDFVALEAALEPSMLAAQVRSLADFAATEWADHRGLVAEVAPGLRIPAAPWNTAGGHVGIAPFVSGLGADNQSVLRELGCSAEEIDAWSESGALRCEPSG